jgi:long-chain acyl-CoA synthetase
MGLYDFTFYDLIRRNAVSYGDLPAWHEVDDGRRISFAEYKQRTDRLAAGLQQAGIKKGDRIGVLGKNSLEFFLLYGSAAALGAIILPINWRLSPAEACGNLSDCEPVLLFVDREFEPVIENFETQVPSIKACYNLKPEAGGYPPLDSLLTDPQAVAPASVATDDGFVIIHTAAVAGKPRGALLSHGNVLCCNMHLNYFLGLTPEDVHLNLLPLFHVGGLFMATAGFHAGALNLNMSKFDAAQAVELIAAHNVSYFFDFSPILASILEESAKAGIPIDSVRAVAGLDSPETIEKYQQLTSGAFYCLYGQTETSCLASLGPYNDCPGSAGRMLPLTEIRLVDENERSVPRGEIGEITVKGPMVFQGYWNHPDANAYTFRNGWHHTGDLGRFDDHGFLFYAGRKAEKELIKPGGENVYPAEVEQVILQHPAVEQVVVFGVPDPKWKEGIKAVCRLKADRSLSAQELISFVGERIASYKKPQYVEFVDALPLTPNGAPDRSEVKKRFGSGPS